MDQQTELTCDMRAVLVDWLVEVQESFELNHETLYSAVRLVDLYLSRTTVNKENLQLVGTTAMLISSKFEVSFLNCQFGAIFKLNTLLCLTKGALPAMCRRLPLHLWWCLHSARSHQDGDEYSQSSRLRYRSAVILQLPSALCQSKWIYSILFVNICKSWRLLIRWAKLAWRL